MPHAYLYATRSVACPAVKDASAHTIYPIQHMHLHQVPDHLARREKYQLDKADLGLAQIWSSATHRGASYYMEASQSLRHLFVARTPDNLLLPAFQPSAN